MDERGVCEGIGTTTIEDAKDSGESKEELTGGNGGGTERSLYEVRANAGRGALAIDGGRLIELRASVSVSC